ncbi:hypothetical protein HDU90_003444 [Geranomyces variabilis]|nr:hypothetical protein HDU90_003444 [Geranomyces variabilis]
MSPSSKDCSAWLSSQVTRLSRLIYPHEIFRLLRAGANINSLSNGLLLNACAHKGSFGVTWWIEHHGTEYRTQNPEGRACGVPDQALLIFREPAPDPMLVNLCACMGQIRLELEKLGLWEAAGDGDDLFDDDDPHWQPEQRPLADDPFDMPPLVI